LVSGWQPAGAAEEAGGGTTAAGVVEAGAAGADECVAGGADERVAAGAAGCVCAGRVCAACVGAGCVVCAVAAACVAWWLGAFVAVGDAVVVRPAVVRPPGDEGDRPAFAAAMMMTRPTRARIAVSALWRAGQDWPRCGGR
jgi:hypothetical protein